MSVIQIKKTKSQQFLDRFLTEDDLEGLSKVIVTAYDAVDGIYKSTPVLGAFEIGRDLRPHLLRVTVEYLLELFSNTQPGFQSEIRRNTAGNCCHLRIKKNGLSMTSHYMGQKCERPAARRALHKQSLAEMNLDLFEFERDQIDCFKNIGYAEIMHGGFIYVDKILINIPNMNQTDLLGSVPINIVSADKIVVEEIVDEPPFMLREEIAKITNGA